MLLARPTQTVDDIEETVNIIFKAVQDNGDEALKLYTQKFDGVEVHRTEVTREALEAAEEAVSAPLKEAIQKAHNNIKRFTKLRKPQL